MSIRRIQSSVFPYAAQLGNMLNDFAPAITETISKYPHHNVVKLDEEKVMIELALAGFSKDEVSITVEDGSLVITGNKTNTDTLMYIHKGIATRPFVFKTSLIEGAKVEGAEMKDGILRVFVKLITPEEKKAQTIEIK